MTVVGSDGRPMWLPELAGRYEPRAIDRTRSPRWQVRDLLAELDDLHRDPMLRQHALNRETRRIQFEIEALHGFTLLEYAEDPSAPDEVFAFYADGSMPAFVAVEHWPHGPGECGSITPALRPSEDWPDLTRTAVALAAYDAVYFDPQAGPNEVDDAAAAVGRAFALDTADRNSADVAHIVRPCRPGYRGGKGWLRLLVERWREVASG